MEEHALNPTRKKQTAQTLRNLGNRMEAWQTLALQVLGKLALIYLIVRAMLR
jgi:hypothetical protein